jgi:hypothetical protein
LIWWRAPNPHFIFCSPGREKIFSQRYGTTDYFIWLNQ